MSCNDLSRWLYRWLIKMTNKCGELFIVLLLFLPLLIVEIQCQVFVDDLNVGKHKNYTISNEKGYIVEIQGLPNNIVTKPPRISVKCADCVEEHPLLVVVTQNTGVLSWEMPFVVHSKNSSNWYQVREQTLCPYDVMDESEFNPKAIKISKLRIFLSTSSNKSVNVVLSVNLNKNFLIELDSNTTVQITPSSPGFLFFKFPSENVTSVLLKVVSPDDFCMIVSVQNVSCPVFDLEENVLYKGHFQTVTRKGGLTLSKDKFPNGFYIVLVMSSGKESCSSKIYGNEQFKTVSLTISKTISVNDYKKAVGITLSVVIATFLILYIVFYCNFKRDVSFEILDHDSTCTDKYGPSTSKGVTESVPEVEPVSSLLANDLNPVIEEEDTVSFSEQDFDSSFRARRHLKVSYLARKDSSYLKKKSDLYFWNVLIVATFYLLPVGELVFNYQLEFNEKGNDVCFYNFLCSHPLWFLADFNHVFSNIGYISFGVLFLILTRIKESFYKLKLSRNEMFYKDCGIPEHFGLFYAMGASLIVEGVLSSCYHLCPNQYNIQFDTTFMYVICTLCIVKIYQARHSDLSANAYSTFFLLAVVLFLSAYGTFKEDLLFWSILSTVHLLLCVHLSLKIYYLGKSSLAYKNMKRTFEKIGSGDCSLRYFKPLFPSRFVLLFIGNAVNWSLVFVRFVYKYENVSSYLLIIFSVNLFLYICFYIIMKFICKERLSLQTILYMVLASGFWAAAMFFFLTKTVSWKETPAKSKLLNKPCELLDFYDSHDIWHFLSAAAVFFSFMVLLTLDEDLVHMKRSKISVF